LSTESSAGNWVDEELGGAAGSAAESGATAE
jgi:hypothetical protein